MYTHPLCPLHDPMFSSKKKQVVIPHSQQVIQQQQAMQAIQQQSLQPQLQVPWQQPQQAVEQPQVSRLRSGISPPVVPDKIPELENMNISELEKLAEGGTALDDFVALRNEVKNVTAFRNDLYSQIVNSAEHILNRKTEADKVKIETEQTFSMFDIKKSEFLRGATSQQKCLQKYSVGSILKVLDTAIAQGEEESEKILDDFLHKKLDINDFVPKYLEKRKEVHIRNEKKERVMHLFGGR